MKALFCGTFDPITLGHMDVIERASKIFDELTVGIFVNSSKNCLFTIEERINLVKEATKNIKNVKCEVCRGLVANYVKENNIGVIIKGIRNARDFDYENEMAGVNKMLSGCETLFMPADKDTQFYSSSMVRILHANGEDVCKYVPLCVNNAIKGK